MFLERLLNLMPFCEEDGIATGTESTQSEPEVEFSFDDGPEESQPEQTKEEPAEPLEEPEKTQEVPAPETTPERFKIKHNKQEVELTKEQLLEAAQKGMDYDRVREARDRFMSPIEQLARQAGKPLDQFITDLEGLVKFNAVEGKKAQIKQDLAARGIDDETAELFAASQAEILYENELLKSGQNAQVQQQTERQRAQAELQDRINRDITEFGKRFPDVNTIPDEVAAEIKNGENPVIAYQSYLIRENQKQLKAAEQNNTNKIKSSGPAKTIGAEKQDEFLAAFSKDY